MEVYCKGCVIVKESVKTQAIKARRVFMGISQLSIPRKEAYALHMTGMQRVSTDRDSCVRKYLVGKAFPRDTRKIFCFVRLYYLIHIFCTHTIYTHITHILFGKLQQQV